MLPKISVVVPCYNMEQYINQTINSIITQNYPNLQLIVVDGGSTDRTLEILEKYKHSISILISEPDNGQYDAINKGFEHADGELLCWLNADDISFPWTLRSVANVFAERTDIAWLVGVPAFLNEDGTVRKFYTSVSAKPTSAIKNGWFCNGGYGYLQQESMFWRRSLWIEAKGLDLRYKLAADFELWTRFAEHAELWTINLPLSAFRIRNSSRSKVLEHSYKAEVDSINKDHKPLPLLYRVFGKKTAANFLLRLLTWKRTKMVHQPLYSENVIYEERSQSISSLSFTSLLLEISRHK